MSLRYCYDCREFCSGRDVTIGEHTYCAGCAQQYIDRMEEQIASIPADHPAPIDGRTHSAECWRWHPDCCQERMAHIEAIIYVGDEPGDSGFEVGWNALAARVRRIMRGGVE
jgi:hypothetical protein